MVGLKPTAATRGRAHRADTACAAIDARASAADEDKPVKDGTVEAWARDPSNPVGAYYGLRKGYRGRFANYVTPVLEMLGWAELEHQPRNNRVRAIEARQ